LIDRFIDSTIAYQHYGLGVDIKLIRIINDHLLKDFKIDLTFLNIVNNNNMLKRLRLRKSLNRYDKFNKNFYNKVQKGFLELTKKDLKRYKIIDSNKDKDKNRSIIIEKIKKII
tara:strand:- start:607 stop:948 length:342 start_codon:yes stop_codon:yes gene_type:complete